MKILKDCKIELAASQDASRAAIGSAYLEIKDGKGTLIATDGRILAYLPVETTPEDLPGYIDTPALQAARKTRLLEIDCKADTLAVATGPSFPRQTEFTFPNWRQVVPTEAQQPAAMTIGIDAKRLWLLAQAMGAQCVRLAIAAPDKPVLVYPNNLDGKRCATDDARGVLMPIRLT